MSTRKVIEEAVKISTVLSTQNKPEAENVCCSLLGKKSEKKHVQCISPKSATFISLLIKIFFHKLLAKAKIKLNLRCNCTLKLISSVFEIYCQITKLK